MSYKGVFKPKHPEKYKGNPTNIIYRSLWEFKFMMYLDSEKEILQWSSEEFHVPYIDPTAPPDRRIRRYFPDFWFRTKDKTFVVEIKPYSQTQMPKTPQKTQQKGGEKPQNRKYLKDAMTYAINQSKWHSCQKFCEERKWDFKIITEYELGIKPYPKNFKRTQNGYVHTQNGDVQ